MGPGVAGLGRHRDHRRLSAIAAVRIGRVGRSGRPVSAVAWIRTVTDLTSDDEGTATATADLLRKPAAAAKVPAQDRMTVVQELTRDDEAALEAATDLLKRPAGARRAMRDEHRTDGRHHVQFDNSEETRDRIRERTPAIRKIEHTIEYLGPVGFLPQLRGNAGLSRSSPVRPGVHRG
ncbi:DUF6192 family protein [Streptomyces sp. NPDC087300]|uniref:DUF6192 family protein n=1 Tax=Streptomyces sp. NPDC087300 TaxID=3365780 RepID=UPI00380FCA30